MENRNALSYIAGADLGQGTGKSWKNQNKGFAKPTAKRQPKQGKLCPACGMVRSVTGKCECNEW